MDGGGSANATPMTEGGFEGDRAPSLRRSCEACRTSKAKCQPVGDEMLKCQRCLKDGRACVFAEAKARPKKTKTSKVRVAEMEQRLDGIFALLQSGKMDTLLEASSAPIPIETPPPPKLTGPVVNSFLVQGSRPLFAPGGASPGSTLPSPWQKFNDTQDVIAKGIVSLEESNQLLEKFRPYPETFPFVVVMPHSSLESLRRDRPFLLLAILAVSATHDLKLQKRLDVEVKENLSRRVIMQGERSMDLLQGLLVYLTWYHYFFNPENEQIYQLSQMLIAMAVDLGITRPARRSKVHGPLSQKSSHEQTLYVRQPFQPPPEDLESRRTFLGCYLMSSSLSIAFRKPSNLKYTDYVGECCRAVAEGNEMPADQMLSAYIHLQRLKEEVSDTFDYDDYENSPIMDAPRIDMLVKSFNKQLLQCQESFPQQAWANPTLSLTYYSLRIYIYEIGLHAIPSPSVDSMSAGESCRNWFSSMSRTNAILGCLDATKEYLDHYLSQPFSRTQNNTLIDEVKVVYAVLVLGKFVSGVKTPHLDPQSLRSAANMHHYMDALIARADKLIQVVDNVEQRNFFWHFRSLIHFSKLWYQQQIDGEFFTTMDSDGVPDCVDMNLLELVHYDAESQTPSSADSVSSSVREKVWTAAWENTAPLAVPLPPPTLLQTAKSPLQGETWSGGFEDFQMTLDTEDTSYDYLGIETGDTEFMRQMGWNS